MLPRPCEVIDPATGQWKAANIVAEDPRFGCQVDCKPGTWFRPGSSQVRAPTSGAAAAVATPAVAVASAAAPAAQLSQARAANIVGRGSVPRPCEVMDRSGQWKRANIVAEDPHLGVQTDAHPGAWNRPGSSTVREVQSTYVQNNPQTLGYLQQQSSAPTITSPQPAATRSNYSVGERVEYFSKSMQSWIPAQVLGPSAMTPGHYKLDVNADAPAQSIRVPSSASPVPRSTFTTPDFVLSPMANDELGETLDPKDVRTCRCCSETFPMMHDTCPRCGVRFRQGLFRFRKNDRVKVWSQTDKEWKEDGVVTDDSAFGKTDEMGNAIIAGSVLVAYAAASKSKWLAPPKQIQLVPMSRFMRAPSSDYRNAGRLPCTHPTPEVVDIIRKSNMTFLRVHGIKTLVAQSRALPRKQDLSKEGVSFVQGDRAADAWMSITSDFPTTRIFITSHPWFGPGHPDLNCKKLPYLLEELKAVGASDDDLVFVDFTGLAQTPRSRGDEEEFGSGLKGLNHMYTSERSEVVMVPKIPADAPNTTPYGSRGWCAFELSASQRANRIANHARYSALVEQAPTANELLDRFTNGQLFFTNGGDKFKVAEMLREIDLKLLAIEVPQVYTKEINLDKPSGEKMRINHHAVRQSPGWIEGGTSARMSKLFEQAPPEVRQAYLMVDEWVMFHSRLHATPDDLDID